MHFLILLGYFFAAGFAAGQTVPDVLAADRPKDAAERTQIRRQGNAVAKNAFREGHGDRAVAALEQSAEVQSRTAVGVQTAQRLLEIAAELLDENDPTAARRVTEAAQQHAGRSAGALSLSARDRALILYLKAQILEHTGTNSAEVGRAYAAAAAADPALPGPAVGEARMAALAEQHRLKQREYEALKQRAPKAPAASPSSQP